ncbi:DUF4434 domain-containing protein [Lutispora thermophila]|uniref:DUF4434 domain-containing protein n=1 Tax=Lutispora thermophila DSM 19022 TaxID=1122184 RepID=A0A1M6DUW1_9FIRM|nr:DUF4434 domain-containing protein [Lutispora thermophila]SHI76943.1 protein of unknown function [Lutispora thermophila DSM 19022]
MRRWKKVYVIILLLVSAIAFSYSEQEVSKTLAKPSGVFSASFIQYWHSKDWDKARWVKELLMLKEASVEELIVQYIADTRDRYAVYPTSIENYEHNQVDMLDNLLSAADFVEMKVRIGLGFNNDWWIKNAMDLEWLMNEAEINKRIFNEVIDNYGHHPSIEGWYIPYEFYQFTAVTKNYQKNLNKFLKEIAWEIKSKSDKEIMISPFYNSNYRWIMPLANWRMLVENAMRNTKIDILALQDGVGVNNVDIKQLSSLFAYTKKSTDKLGIKLYGNVETFETTSDGNKPAAKERISIQMLLEKPYVEKFVAFSLNHYQNYDDKEDIKSFINYLNQYLYH